MCGQHPTKRYKLSQEHNCITVEANPIMFTQSKVKVVSVLDFKEDQIEDEGKKVETITMRAKG